VKRIEKMSVNVETPCDSVATSAPLNSFDGTTGTLHRIYFSISDLPTWYAIMREARQQFGRNWRCQPKVKRRLERLAWHLGDHYHSIWFEVPDLSFATWAAVKLGVKSSTTPGK
jgi:hypothetical protein